MWLIWPGSKHKDKAGYLHLLYCRWWKIVDEEGVPGGVTNQERGQSVSFSQ
ncbi:hypothetical protein [Erwinia endophytica]|uniref:hypothetical protein n=1 Tax=Erwinia endophytica TaxID=1563158 RepID=UPI00186BA8B0|nr:hypothetical protein [Erwinia endophytica]